MKPRVWHYAVSQPIVILMLLWLALGGLSDQVRAPLRFTGAHLLTLGNVQAGWDAGRWWSLPDLAVTDPDTDPLQLSGSSHVDYFLLNVAHLVSRGVPSVVTLAWALMLVIGAAASSWCLRRLGASADAAWAAGILFALSPFALAYNTESVGWMPAFVPFAAFAGLTLASGRSPLISDRDWLIVIAGNALLALNSLYYAAFGIVVVLAGAIAGVVRSRNAASIRAGATVLLALSVATAVNVWTTNTALDTGTPIVQARAPRPSESELHAVKLRELVTPLDDNWIPPLRAWAAMDDKARFPYSIGRTALGLVAAIGLVGLLIVLFVPSAGGTGESGESLRAASRLTLLVLLIATTGGFSAVISMLLAPTFTNYSMMVPFLAFFSLTAVTIWIDRLLIAHRQWVRVVAWTAILAFALCDHGAALDRVIVNRTDVASEAQSVRDLVFALEKTLPAGSRVVQLPIQPEPKQQLKMHAFDHLKPYVMSRTLSWSFPPTTVDQQRWLNERADLEPLALLDRLREDGVSAVVIDRLAYPNDAGELVAAIQNSLSTAEPDVTHNRYVAFDIRKR